MAAENRLSTPQSPLTAIEVPISMDLPHGDSTAEAAAAAQPAADEPWEDSIRQAVRVAAQSQGFCRGQIGVLVTDDATIQQLNRRHLDHDHPTDVISFDYQRGDGIVEGELVVSLCTAQRLADEVGWDWRNELLLYVVHGTLHICGLQDSTTEQRQQMRRAEQAALSQLGINDTQGLRQGFEPETSCEQGDSE